MSRPHVAASASEGDDGQDLPQQGRGARGGCHAQPRDAGRRPVGERPLGGLDHVGQEHRPGHRADPAGVGADEAGDVPDVGVHVARDDRLAGRLVDDPRDADVEHRGAGLDHVGGDDAGHAGRRDDDVGLAHLGREVARAGVAQRDRGVLRRAGEDEAQRATHGEAAADDDDLRAGDRHVIAAQQLDAADRGARQRRRLAEHEPAEVHGVQPVDVLGRVDGREDGVLVEAGGLLHDEAGALGVVVELAHHGEHLVLRGAGGQVAAHAADADLGAVAVLGADVPVAARVVADEHGAEAGDHPVLGEGGDARRAAPP